MKLQKLKSDTTKTLNVKSKKEFTVDTSNQMIVSILRDKLYSNKIGAVCREVASNSRDANRESGNPQTPVIINISSDGSILEDGISISFKDSGVGISPSRIDNVFLKYGSSTKRDSNNQTGGFGIGAKTPFAYTNEFLISTISEDEGKRLHNVYQAVISNEGGQEVSQLLLVSSSDTNESTGTEIIIPIQESDLIEFVSECTKATILWDVQPTLTVNGENELKKLDTLIDGEDFKVIYGEYNANLFDSHHDGVIMQIDGIPYRLNNAQVGRVDSKVSKHIDASKLFDMQTRYNYDNTHRNTVLVFNTGELTMSASREEIEYTQENIDAIFEKVLSAEACIEKMIIDSFESLNTNLEKIATYNNYANRSENNFKNWFVKNDEEKLKDFFRVYGANMVIKCVHPDYDNTGNIKRMSENKIDFFRIANSNRFSFSKKNSINGVRPGLDFINDNLFVLRMAGESNAYAKNLTLQTKVNNEDKSGVVFMNFGHHEEETNPFTDLLIESGVEIIKYADVERTKVQRSYSSSGVKKNASLGTIYARKLNIHGYYSDVSKLKMEYNKKENVMTDWDMREAEEGETNVLVPVNDWTDLKDLDKTKTNLRSALRKDSGSDINLVIVNKKVENETKELRLSYDQTCGLLVKYGYRIVFVKNSEIKKVENDKNAIVGLSKAFSKLLKNKEFIKDVVNSARQSVVQEVAEYKKGSYAYDTLYKNPLKKKFLLLAGFNIDNFKTPMSDSLDTTKSKGDLFNGSAMLELADRFSKKVKGRDYSKYMTSEKLEEAMGDISNSHPMMHYLFEKFDSNRNWDFSEYDIENKEGETKREGISIMREEFENMLDKELKKLKK
tara:strand:- start:7518 stop:10043 length:2526 start_codon:yes stop_codon:yes gene_type:complete